MTGGGFGGCVVALIDANRGDDIQAAFRHFYRRATGIDPVTFITRPGTGATAACRGSGGFDRGERHNPG
jgi:galactokinase